MHGNYRLACRKLTGTIGAAGLAAGVMLAGGTGVAPAVASAKLMYVPVPSPQPPSHAATQAQPTQNVAQRNSATANIDSGASGTRS